MYDCKQMSATADRKRETGSVATVPKVQHVTQWHQVHLGRLVSAISTLLPVTILEALRPV